MADKSLDDFNERLDRERKEKAEWCDASGTDEAPCHACYGCLAWERAQGHPFSPFPPS